MAESIDDDAIRACIQREFEQRGHIVCPHTACALERLRRLRAEGDRTPALVAATAHPAKFETVIEPLIGRAVPLPPSLSKLLQRPSQADPLAADPVALARVLATG